MKKIISVVVIIALAFFLTSCIKETGEKRIKEAEPEYPNGFNVQFSYEFDHQIDIRENKYMLSGCYPETDFYMPFSVEDKNEIYNEIIGQDLLDYDWAFSTKYLREKDLLCSKPTTNLGARQARALRIDC